MNSKFYFSEILSCLPYLTQIRWLIQSIYLFQFLNTNFWHLLVAERWHICSMSVLLINRILRNMVLTNIFQWPILHLMSSLQLSLKNLIHPNYTPKKQKLYPKLCYSDNHYKYIFCMLTPIQFFLVQQATLAAGSKHCFL